MGKHDPMGVLCGPGGSDLWLLHVHVDELSALKKQDGVLVFFTSLSRWFISQDLSQGPT
jgi:hypothetical protein